MDEYISREAAIALLKKWADGYSYIETPTEDAINEFNAIHAADVRPVPKGQWVSFDAKSEKCSNCKRRYYISALFAVGGNNEPDFCPGCGAYMGGDACAE